MASNGSESDSSIALVSPPFRAGLALERSNELGCDPSAVEASGLGESSLASHAGIHHRSVEREVPREDERVVERVLVGPRDARHALRAHDDVEVCRLTLPLTP